MGFHATINAGTDQFGNMRHKSAPRVRASERVTGSAQVEKFHKLAGKIIHFTGLTPDVTPAMVEFMDMIARRKVTALTETVSAFVKVSPTRYELRTRSIGGSVVVYKVQSREFTGWRATWVFGDHKMALASVSKGDSVNTNGDRADCCRYALNHLQMILIGLDTDPEICEDEVIENSTEDSGATIYAENYLLDILSGTDADTQDYGMEFMCDDMESELFLIINGEKLTVTKVSGGYSLIWS